MLAVGLNLEVELIEPVQELIESSGGEMLELRGRCQCPSPCRHFPRP
jgi:hypothetical protein